NNKNNNNQHPPGRRTLAMAAGGLSKEQIIYQAREAGRLYGQAKESPGIAAAAERRAGELCAHIAASIQAEILREDKLEAQAEAKAAAVASRSGTAASELPTRDSRAPI
ncbi:unnamed protein product, partial [Polarella glacialis]